MVAPEAVTTRVRRQHPDRLSTAGASRPKAQAIRRAAEPLEILGPCSQHLIVALHLGSPSGVLAALKAECVDYVNRNLQPFYINILQ